MCMQQKKIEMSGTLAEKGIGHNLGHSGYLGNLGGQEICVVIEFDKLYNIMQKKVKRCILCCHGNKK